MQICPVTRLSGYVLHSKTMRIRVRILDKKRLNQIKMETSQSMSLGSNSDLMVKGQNVDHCSTLDQYDQLNNLMRMFTGSLEQYDQINNLMGRIILISVTRLAKSRRGRSSWWKGTSTMTWIRNSGEFTHCKRFYNWMLYPVTALYRHRCRMMLKIVSWHVMQPIRVYVLYEVLRRNFW